MRIVGGRFRGRALTAPAGADVRPTSDKVRESLFNILSHGVDGFELDGIHVLDLFAGTGALGLEALSRGAASCVFVENSARSRAAIQENMATLGAGGSARLFRRDATDLGPSTQSVRFGLVFADPPYGQGLAERAIQSAVAGNWLAQDALIVIEESAFATIEIAALADVLIHRQYGDTQVVLARTKGGGDEA